MTSPTPTDTQPWTQSDDTFAARLALVRWRKGWNIKEAANACGLPPATWRMWELDGSLPRDHISVAKKIALRAGCDFHWLLLGPDADRPTASGDTVTNYGERVIAVAGQPRDAHSPYRGRPVHRTRPVQRSPLLTRA